MMKKEKKKRNQETKQLSVNPTLSSNLPTQQQEGNQHLGPRRIRRKRKK